tara:strand:+ start:512 stop:703 length:192 start_codon:yes stop_codon:yes gene_type:complete
MKMTKQEILDRVQNVLNQGVDTESQDLDLLRHDLENDIIQGKSIRNEIEERMIRRIKFNQECG